MQSINSNQPHAWGKLVPLHLPLDSSNLSLIKSSCTIGKGEINDIQIFDSRIDDVHYRIYKETNETDDLYWIENLSCNGIVVEEKLVSKGNKHQLAPGDKIGFLSLNEMKSDTILTHIFCPVTKGSNKVKQYQEESQSEGLEENKEHKSSSCKEHAYKNNLECSICLCVIYNCVTVLPCLHNFCASCISHWILESEVCPNCKQEYSDLNKNPKLDEVINSFIAENPELKESQEYYDEKDKKDRIKPLPVFEIVTFSDGDIYGGEWINGRKQGKGKMIFATGDVYEGDWVNNKMEGKGKAIYEDGHIYEGDWVDSRKEGKGKMIYSDGMVYEGDWVNDMWEGKGKVIYAKGHIYEGDLINDKREGKGKMIYTTGEVFEGDWANDLRVGKGKIRFSNGSVYEGDWMDDMIGGKGKLIISEGHTYEGDWVNNMMEGKGKMIFPDGAVHEGDWRDNMMNGKGKVISPEGHIYEGDWVNDKWNGKGKSMLTNGDVYEGDWVNSKMEGKGKMTYANGEVYEGDWMDGKKEGKGKMIFADGEVYDGDWVDDKKKENGI